MDVGTTTYSVLVICQSTIRKYNNSRVDVGVTDSRSVRQRWKEARTTVKQRRQHTQRARHCTPAPARATGGRLGDTGGCRRTQVRYALWLGVLQPRLTPAVLPPALGDTGRSKWRDKRSVNGNREISRVSLHGQTSGDRAVRTRRGLRRHQADAHSGIAQEHLAEGAASDGEAGPEKVLSSQQARRRGRVSPLWNRTQPQQKRRRFARSPARHGDGPKFAPRN